MGPTPSALQAVAAGVDRPLSCRRSDFDFMLVLGEKSMTLRAGR